MARSRWRRSGDVYEAHVLGNQAAWEITVRWEPSGWWRVAITQRDVITVHWSLQGTLQKVKRAITRWLATYG